jgi:L-lactate dehydrogenase (cytochrome)
MTCKPAQDEFEMNMRLIGAPTLKDIVPDMVDTRSISSHIVPVPGDRLYDNNCEPHSAFAFQASF